MPGGNKKEKFYKEYDFSGKHLELRTVSVLPCRRLPFSTSRTARYKFYFFDFWCRLFAHCKLLDILQSIVFIIYKLFVHNINENAQYFEIFTRIFFNFARWFQSWRLSILRSTRNNLKTHMLKDSISGFP